MIKPTRSIIRRRQERDLSGLIVRTSGAHSANLPLVGFSSVARRVAPEFLILAWVKRGEMTDHRAPTSLQVLELTPSWRERVECGVESPAGSGERAVHPERDLGPVWFLPR